MSTPQFSLSNLPGGHSTQAWVLTTSVRELEALGEMLSHITHREGAGVGWWANHTAEGWAVGFVACRGCVCYPDGALARMTMEVVSVGAWVGFTALVLLTCQVR